MKVQLRQSVPNLGRAGEIVTVADAYARNFLLPKKLAVLASARTINLADQQAKKQAAQQAKHQAAWQAARQQLATINLQLTAKANPNGTLFAAVKSEQVTQALAREHQLMIGTVSWNPDHWKSLGQHTATLRWPDGQTTQFSFLITHGS